MRPPGSRRAAARWGLLGAFLAVWLGPPSSVRADLETAPTDREIATLAERLRASDPGARRAAADALLALGPDATPALMARLARRRVPTPAALWNALQRVQPPRLSEEEEDRFDPLDPLLRASRTDGWAAATNEVTEAIVVIRAIGRGRTEAGLTALVNFMPRERETFRREVAKTLIGASPWSLPSLIRCRRTGATDAMKRFCRSIVRELYADAPADAVQQSDNELLSAILLAYGDTKDPVAMNVVGSFVASEREIVRDAARRAIAQYGGNAVWVLRQTWENLTGREPPNEWNVDRTARELYGLVDRTRSREADGWMARGLRAARGGDTAAMLAAFDTVLALAPRYERRKDMVPGLLARAEELLRSSENDARALAMFRLAYRLDPEGPQSRRLQAHLAYLDGKEWLDRGLWDPQPFQRATAFDARHPLAREALDQIDAAARDERRVRPLPLKVGIGLGLVSVAVLAWSLRRRGATPAPSPPNGTEA